jgi:hypothetical protein
MGMDSSPDVVGFERDGKGNLMVICSVLFGFTNLGLSKFDGMFGWHWLFMHVVCLYRLCLFNFLFQNYDGRSTLCEVITSADTNLPSVSVEDYSTIKEKGSKKIHYVQMMISCFVQAFTGLLFVGDLY